MGRLLVCLVAGSIFVLPAAARAATCDITGPDLIVDGITCELSGAHTFTSVQVIHGGRLDVAPYVGGDPALTGNLQLRAASILVDATSIISARGAGYATPLCGDGVQPGGTPAAGGCSVLDSGGGGSHFGAGGRGTKDCSTSGCTFDQDWEEDCGNTNTGAACSDTTNCRDNDALPSTASTTYFHNIYAPEFGGSGGDKGCRDGDGYGLNTSGSGGGRIVLAGITPTSTGTVTIAGQVIADGKRGCGFENDSGGGGAGGTILIAGDLVTIGGAAIVSASGGLGGDTRGTFDTTGDCAGAQQGSTCDDCGGGGGGGIISVLSRTATIIDSSAFRVSGALGGTCAICQGEAGGGAGELQLNGAYLGELCDGFDNDFDGVPDNDLPMLTCATGVIPSCVGGVPQQCPADTPACVGPVTDTRARFAVIVDSSGSMLTDLDGTPSFGDGSTGHVGLDMNGDGTFGNDSKLFLAKRALSTVIAAYPDIDFALARYHQDQQTAQACQLAHWFECAGLCCSYDDPRNNTTPAPTPACTVDGGSLGPIGGVLTTSPGEECINYAGNCGAPRRGADFLAGFGSDINTYLMWLDGTEASFIDDETPGAYCAGGDCELRGTGPTPLANSLQAAADFLAPQIACDAAASLGCRTYGTILLTDGAESCNGNPVAAASALRTSLGVETYVIGFSVLPSEEAGLDAIAHAGSFSGARDAFLVGSEDALANALASIVADSIVFETCNGDDDDCDSRTDEDFPAVGMPCHDAELGACQGTGVFECNGAGDGVTCHITDDGEAPGTEICNGLDDNCNGTIDEDLSCATPCTPAGRDLCNGVDDDCNGAVDDDDPDVGTACGDTDAGVCQLGTNACIAGDLVCVGAIYPDPQGETCDNDDDDCDLEVDEDAPCPTDTACIDGGCRLPCGSGEFECPLGFACVTIPDGRFCVPGPCAACGPGEICVDDACVDPCAGVTCDAHESCRLGECLDCTSLGCAAGEVCLARECVADPCADVDCGGCDGGDLGCSCVEGDCVPNCDDPSCPDGTRCDASGACVEDACADVACPATQTCVDGACAPDPCNGVVCGPGDVCVAGSCETDPCPATDCSAGRHCEVTSGGDPVCVADEPGLPIDTVTAAGGGCSAGGDATPLLGLLLLLVKRRRR